MIRSSNERLHRAWERRHPYNFVCLVDVTTAVDPERLRSAAVDTLVEFGLSEANGGDNRLEVMEVLDLERHALLELNTTLTSPVRLAIQRVEPADGRPTCRIAVTYRHFFFDGTNSTVFIRRTLLRASGHVPPRFELGAFLRGRDWLLANGLAKTPGLIFRLLLDIVKMRTVFARGDGRESPEAEAIFVDYSPDLLNRLRREGDRVGATINDVLIARMARAAFTIESSRPTRRRDVAISMAVSLRNGIEPLHQGVCTAVCPVYLRSETDILRMVLKQTTKMKATRSYMRSVIGTGIGSRLWRVPETGCRTSNSYIPSLALTNMRIPACIGDELISRWRRVVPPGPMAPLIVTAITHSESLEMSVSWRKSLFSADEVAVLINTLSE